MHQLRMLTKIVKKCILVLLILVTALVLLHNINSNITVRSIVSPPPVRRISYHFPVGVTELKQCQRAFNLFPMKVIEKPIYTEFNYNVSLISVDADAGILLHVFEVRNDRATGGGSSFLALSNAFRRQMCFYEDYFSGNYVIWCPPPAPGKCSQVSIEIKFLNFSAYTIGYFPLTNGRLWQRTVCWNETTRRRALYGINIPSSLTPPWKTTNVEAPHTCLIDWFRDGGKLSVMNDNGVTIPFLDNINLCQRVRRYQRIVMVGASHMRYKFNYMSFTCAKAFGPKNRKHGTTKVKGLYYIQNFFMSDCANLWTKHLRPMKLTKRDAVLIQHGAHDMYSNGTRFTITTSLHRYFDLLKVIQGHSKRLGFRLVVVTSPPFGDKVVRTTKDNRNNFSLAALVRLVHTELAHARIDVFDEFAVLLAFYNEDALPCTGHYLCPDRKKGIVHGYYGIIAMHLLLRHLVGEANITTC